jgi:hypothetical protein
MLPKNTRDSIDHQKMGTWENHPKSNKITLKAPKKPYNPIYSYSISSFTTAYTVYRYVSIEENHRHDHQS